MDNASKYVTQAKYAGQPASVGRGVVTKIGGRVRSAVIDEIRDGEPMFALSGGGAPIGLSFEPTSCAADVGAMPDGSWTWPPRV